MMNKSLGSFSSCSWRSYSRRIRSLQSPRNRYTVAGCRVWTLSRSLVTAYPWRDDKKPHQTKENEALAAHSDLSSSSRFTLNCQASNRDFHPPPLMLQKLFSRHLQALLEFRSFRPVKPSALLPPLSFGYLLHKHYADSQESACAILLESVCSSTLAHDSGT